MKYSAESFQWQPRLFSTELPCWRLPVPSFSLHLSFWCMTLHIKQYANLLLLFQSCIIQWETQRTKQEGLPLRKTDTSHIYLWKLLRKSRKPKGWQEYRLPSLLKPLNFRLLGCHNNATFKMPKMPSVHEGECCLFVVLAILLVWANWHYWHRVLQAWFGSPSSSRMSIWLHSWGHITNPVTRWTHLGSSLGDREGSVGMPLTGSVN